MGGNLMDPVATAWKENLLAVMENHRGKPLLLSGGVDSGTLLAAAIELGWTPRCYAFRLGDVDSQDVSVSRRMAADHGVELYVTTIVKDARTLVRDVREVISLLRTDGKAKVQCSLPIMYLVRQVREHGFKAAIVGTGAVCLDDKHVAILCAKEGEEAARAYRREKMGDKDRDCGTGRMHQMGRIFGVPLSEPYSENPLRDHGLSLDMAELNRPRQKGIAVRAFPWFWEKGYWRRNSPLQVNSGIREWHDTLLKTYLNRNGSKMVASVYTSILTEVLGGRQLA